MTRNIESKCSTFGDDENYKRLDAFNRFCLRWVLMISFLIFTLPCNCSTYILCLAKSIVQLSRRHYFAVIVLVLSASVFSASIVILRGDVRIATAIYCMSFFACSFLSLIFKRGSIKIAFKRRYERLEHQKLIVTFNPPDGQKVERPTGYGTRDDRQPLERILENLKEPMPESEDNSAIGFQRSDSLTPLNVSDGISTGTPDNPESADIFVITEINDDSWDSEEPFQGLSEAHITADAVKTFGPPLQVFGADSYRVLLHSSDENCFTDDSSDESSDIEVKTIEVPVEVHHSDSFIPLTSFNDDSSAAPWENVECKVKEGFTL